MQNNTNQNVSQPNSQQQHPYNVEQTNQSNTRDNYHYEKGMRALRKYKKIAWFTGICGFLLLIVGIVMPIILINFIKDQAKQQVVMQQSNYDQWGQIPGDTGMVLERQFTFFNWTNAERFFIYGDKPTLNESQTVYYQEFQNFTNPQYNEDGSIVSYQFQEFFLPIKGSTGEELQTVVNLGPMGFWYQIKQASRVQVGSQAFYGLISGLVDQLLDTIDIGVMSQTQINTIDNWKKFLQVGDQQPLIQQIVNVQDFIFNDPNYGIHSNSYIWMVAFKEMISSQQNKPTCMFLVNYFKINYNNLSSFFTIKHDDFQNSINAGRQLLVKGQFECTQTDEQLIRACLAAGQWSATKLGMSIVEQNKTTTGFPEINFFQENYFKDYIDSSDVYQKIQFPQEWAEKVTYYIQNPVDNTDFTKNTNTLLNQGNLGVLYTNGELYDKTKEIIYLKTIADRFEINEQYFGQNYLDAAYLFWEYAKYIVDIFAESKNYKNGGSAVAGLTGAASQGLYTVFSETQDILAITLISPMIRIYFKLNNIADCQAFQNYVNTNLNSQYQLCIDASPFKQFGSDQMDSMKVLYECNMYGGFSEYCNSLNVLFGNKNFIQQLTSDALPLIQKAIQFADSQMQTAYNCQNEVQKKCSYYEIAVKQWYNMEIIRNIPPILIQAGFPNPGTDTLKQWAHELPHAYEWGYYVEHFKDTFTQPPPQLSYDQLVQLLGFDYLFSGTRQIQMFLIDTNFETTYFFQDPNQIRDYLRFLNQRKNRRKKVKVVSPKKQSGTNLKQQPFQQQSKQNQDKQESKQQKLRDHHIWDGHLRREVILARRYELNYTIGKIFEEGQHISQEERMRDEQSFKIVKEQKVDILNSITKSNQDVIRKMEKKFLRELPNKIITNEEELEIEGDYDDQLEREIILNKTMEMIYPKEMDYDSVYRYFKIKKWQDLKMLTKKDREVLEQFPGLIYLHPEIMMLMIEMNQLEEELKEMIQQNEEFAEIYLLEAIEEYKDEIYEQIQFEQLEEKEVQNQLTKLKLSKKENILRIAKNQKDKIIGEYAERKIFSIKLQLKKEKDYVEKASQKLRERRIQNKVRILDKLNKNRCLARKKRATENKQKLCLGHNGLEHNKTINGTGLKDYINKIQAEEVSRTDGPKLAQHLLYRRTFYRSLGTVFTIFILQRRKTICRALKVVIPKKRRKRKRKLSRIFKKGDRKPQKRPIINNNLKESNLNTKKPLLGYKKLKLMNQCQMNIMKIEQIKNLSIKIYL